MAPSKWNKRKSEVELLAKAADQANGKVRKVNEEFSRLESLGLDRTSYAAEVYAVLTARGTEASAATQALAKARTELFAEQQAERDAKCKVCGGAGYITQSHQSNDGSMSSDYSWTTECACSCEYGKKWVKQREKR